MTKDQYDLSIICPAIRSDRWLNMYTAIEASFTGSWELVLVTERELPEELKHKGNIKVIFSERAPMQKQQQGLEHVEGEYVTVMSDDSVWLPGALDRAFIETIPKLKNYKELIVLKYLEGKEFDFPSWYIKQVPPDMQFKTNYDFMKHDKYYWSDSHESSNMVGIPYHSPILSCAIFTKKLLFEIGGWRADLFESQAMGNVELAARLMWYGCTYIIQDFISSTCGYYESSTGDHSAIHYAQINHDQPILNKMFKDNSNRNNLIIPMDNWKLTPEVWYRKRTPNA